MNCPKCQSMMERIEINSRSLGKFSGSEIDRCLSCGGLWFDQGEAAALMTPEVAKALDTGCPDRARKNNAKQDCACPRCRVPMVATPFKGQPHILHDQCPRCGGAYFDAGEFRDATHRGVFEWIKTLFKKK